MAEVLIHGVTGGRERAIGQAIEESDEVSRVIYDNGNLEEGLSQLSGDKDNSLIVVGPEAPLVEGVADNLREEGYPVFGASKSAAQYEASKSRAVKMMQKSDIVHPHTVIAEGKNMAEDARFFVRRNNPLNYVIKADGLAGGKGVVLPETQDEAREVVEGMIDGSLFGGAGGEVINFAHRKKGPEVSAMVFVGNGKDDFVILPLSQDHKRLKDGDQGPNTGGMGAYAPVPEHIVSPAQYEKIREKAYASLAGMEAEGADIRGMCMYMGLMMSEDLEYDESDLIEYNIRLGDPEAQVILPLLKEKGIDNYRLFRSAAEFDLEYAGIDFRYIGFAAVSVCLADGLYPNSKKPGEEIHGLDQQYGNVTVQLAGVKEEDGKVVTNGGRILYVTGVGEDIDQAVTKAYAAIGERAIHFADMQYRNDIGWQARRAA